MKRYTETELEKIVRIGKARIDHIIEAACVELEGVKPKRQKTFGRLLHDINQQERYLRGKFPCPYYDIYPGPGSGIQISGAYPFSITVCRPSDLIGG
jgi:hypothetical protein